MFQSARKTRRFDPALKKREVIVGFDKLTEKNGYKPKNMVNKILNHGFVLEHDAYFARFAKTNV